MVGVVKFSFSCRGVSAQATDDEIFNFFQTLGTVVSWRRVPPPPGYPSGAAYVNFSHVNSVNEVLALNGTAPAFNKGVSMSVRQQAVFVAQVANALNEIKFSVSIRGISRNLPEANLREVLTSLAKLHSLKIADVQATSWKVHAFCDIIPRPIDDPDVCQQKGGPVMNAYANFSDGEVSSLTALDGTAPDWNHGLKLSVRQQVSPDSPGFRTLNSHHAFLLPSAPYRHPQNCLDAIIQYVIESPLNS
jgi:hypothetical protein